jgi:CBS domain-containing protein
MSNIETTSVSCIMTRNVKTEREDQNVLTACRIMHENSIGSVIIEKKDVRNPCLILEDNEKGEEHNYIVTPWDIVMKTLKSDHIFGG